MPHEKSLHVFPFAIHAWGRDLSLLSFFIQITDSSVCSFCCDPCPGARANLCHPRAQGAVSLWCAQERGSSPALPLALAPCGSRCCFSRDGGSGCGLRPPEPRFANLYFFISFESCKTLNYPDFTGVLPVCTKSSNTEREWGREVSEWLAVTWNRSITKTNPSTAKWSVNTTLPDGIAGASLFWVPLALGRTCVLSQKITESFLCCLTSFKGCFTGGKLYPVLQIGNCEAKKETLIFKKS